MQISRKPEEINSLTACESKRNLTSYCYRHYVIQRWKENFTGYEDIEYLNNELNEVAMLKYMHNKYPTANYRLVQSIVSEIYYVIE